MQLDARSAFLRDGLSTTQVVKEIPPHHHEQHKQDPEQNHRQGGRLLRHRAIIPRGTNPALSHHVLNSHAQPTR
jgi:hypothetical protein